MPVESRVRYNRAVAQPFSIKNVLRIPMFLVPTVLLLIIWSAGAKSQVEDSSAVGRMKVEAEALSPLVTSDLALSFLAAVPSLPRIETPRTVYVKKEPRELISEAEYLKKDSAARAAFEKRELDEGFYYYTRYGTPLAFVRALDLLGQAGLKSFEGARMVDFGFGSIGQLRLMASLGADVTGIEVDPLLEILYSDPSDTGPVPRVAGTVSGAGGCVRLLFGSFPSDPEMLVEGRLDAFISKNTLKRGYIHPEREVDPKMLVDLGVDDSTYVQTVYDLLKPGAYFLIYNLHPARSLPTDEKYIPWSDGRSPFDRALFESIGFEVVAFDVDDTEFARTMGTSLGWGESMNFEKDLFGMYTLVRKSR